MCSYNGIVILKVYFTFILDASCWQNYKVNKYAQWTVEPHHLFTVTYHMICSLRSYIYSCGTHIPMMTNCKLGEIGRHNKQLTICNCIYILWHLSRCLRKLVTIYGFWKMTVPISSSMRWSSMTLDMLSWTQKYSVHNIARGRKILCCILQNLE